MACVGKELRLGLGRLECGVTCLCQLGLCLFQRGDVLGDPKRPNDLPIGVVHRHLGGEHPAFAAVVPRFLFHLADDRLSRLEDGLLVLECEPGVFLTEKIGVRFSYRLSGIAEPEVAGHGPADHQEPAVAILEIYPVRNTVEQRAQQVPLMSQRDLGMPLPGDIPKNPLHADTPPRLVADRCLDDVHPRLLPLRRDVFLDRIQRLAALHDAQVVLSVLAREVGREKIKVSFADYLPARLPQFLAETGVGKREPPGSILTKNILRQILHQ